MTHAHSDAQYDYFLDHFRGIPVKFVRDRSSGAMHIDAGSLAACLGYASTEAMVGDDKVLDLLNEHQKQSGQSPLKRITP